jgi:Uma2 family endonuclease
VARGKLAGDSEEPVVTALPQPSPDQPPVRLLTVAEYAALGEDDQHRWELQEGIILLSPSPKPRHMRVSGRLFMQLEPQVPADLCLIQDIDVDLELVPPDEPGWSRRPDLIVVDRAAIDRVDRDGGLLRASEVRLAVEIVSPGSKRMDTVIKRGEYADAGIPRYWIIDLDPPLSLLDCHLAEGFGYLDGGDVTGTFETTEPFPIRLDLDFLR